MSLPRVTSRDEWAAVRKALLEKEKEFTRRRDALNVERRELLMVEITKDYLFDGPHGNVRLVDMFEGRKQLIVYHFMFIRSGATAARPARPEPTRSTRDSSVTRPRATPSTRWSPGHRSRSSRRTRPSAVGTCPGTRRATATSTTTSASRSTLHAASTNTTTARSTSTPQDWEEPKGRTESARSNQPDFSS